MTSFMDDPKVHLHIVKELKYFLIRFHKGRRTEHTSVARSASAGSLPLQQR